MLNGWAMLFGILCVFFISAAVFGQAELSDSEIIKEINDSERRTRDHVDMKIEDIKKNFESLDKNVAVFNNGITKEVEGMSKRIDDMQGKINLILNLIIGGIITLFLSLVLSIVGYITKPLWEDKLPWRDKSTEGDTDKRSPENLEKIDEQSSDESPSYVT